MEDLENRFKSNCSCLSESFKDWVGSRLLEDMDFLKKRIEEIKTRKFLKEKEEESFIETEKEFIKIDEFLIKKINEIPNCD